MSAQDQPLVRAQGVPAPQYFNRNTNSYEVIEGEFGANRFIERGRIVKDAFGGNASGTFNYGENMYGLGIVNDGETDVIVDINDITIILKAGESFDDLFDPFTLFTITASGPYRTVVRA